MGPRVSDAELDCTHITIGTVGEPGDRTFYLQAAEGDRVFTFKLEKGQAAALADRLVDIVDELAGSLGADPVEPAPDMALRVPIQPDFTVGAMSLGFDTTRDRIAILCMEFVAEITEDDDVDDEAEDDAEDSVERAEVSLLLTRTRARTLARHAREVVAAGRPSCELCGFPKGANHICPRTNGRSG